MFACLTFWFSLTPLSPFPTHSGHGATLGEFKMHVPQTIRSRRLLLHPHPLGHIADVHPRLRHVDLVGAVSRETHCPIPFQNESDGGGLVVFNVAGVVQ